MTERTMKPVLVATILTAAALISTSCLSLPGGRHHASPNGNLAGAISDGAPGPPPTEPSTAATSRQEWALSQLLAEASDVAKSLDLPENLPMTRESVANYSILGPRMRELLPGTVGCVETERYEYCASRDCKLCFIDSARQDELCLAWGEHCRWPMSRMDTNAPYETAVRWLKAASMDVAALARDCTVTVAVDDFWNAKHLGMGTFTPIFCVDWLSRDNSRTAASVKLFMPTRTLIYLRVEDPRYILRRRIDPKPLAAGDRGTPFP